MNRVWQQDVRTLSSVEVEESEQTSFFGYPLWLYLEEFLQG
jgi:hypothetical protein